MSSLGNAYPVLKSLKLLGEMCQRRAGKAVKLSENELTLKS